MEKFEKVLNERGIEFNKCTTDNFWWETTTLYTKGVIFSRVRQLREEKPKEYFTIGFSAIRPEDILEEEDMTMITLNKVSTKQFEAILDRCDEFVEKYNNIYQELQNHTKNFEKSIIDMED